MRKYEHVRVSDDALADLRARLDRRRARRGLPDLVNAPRRFAERYVAGVRRAIALA